MIAEVRVGHVSQGAVAGFTQVYVGRGRGSVLGNPFSLHQRSAAMEGALAALRAAPMDEAKCRWVAEFSVRLPVRGEAVELFEAWLRVQCRCPGAVVYGAVMALAQRSAAGEALLLTCHCAPRRCHADVLARAVRGYAERLKR